MSTKRDLEIYRGTYRECMAQPTVDMKIYLAWDTQEIFVGNSVGTKVPYGNNKVLQNELFEKLNEVKESIPGLIISALESDENVDSSFKSEVLAIENRLKSAISSEIDTKLQGKFNSLFSQLDNIKNEIIDISAECSKKDLISGEKIQSLALSLTQLESTLAEKLILLENKFKNADVNLKNSLTGKINGLKSKEELLSQSDFDHQVGVIKNNLTELIKGLEIRVKNINNIIITEFGKEKPSFVRSVVFERGITTLREDFNTLLDTLNLDLKAWVREQNFAGAEALREFVNEFFEQNTQTALEIENASSRAFELAKEHINTHLAEVSQTVANSANTYTDAKALLTKQAYEEADAIINGKIETLRADIADMVLDLADTSGATAVLINTVVEPKITAASNSLTTSFNNSLQSLENRVIRYLTGDEIDIDVNRLELLGDLSSFKPTFCIVDSERNDYYTAGSFYYYDINEQDVIRGASGGGSEKEVVNIGLLFGTNGQLSYEINSAPITFTLTASVPNNVVDYATNYRIISGANTTPLNITSSNTVATQTVAGFSRAQLGSTTFRFTADPIPATKTTRYEVTDKSIAVNVYAPAQYGIAGKPASINQLSSSTISNGTYVFNNLEVGDQIAFYQTSPINKTFKVGSMEIATEFEVTQENILVNGVNVAYYKYYYTIGNVSGSNSLTIKLV